MAKPFNTEISTSIDMTQAQRRLIFKLNEAGRVDVMYDIGQLMADYYNEYVPMQSGELRNSVRVYANPYRFSISWGNTPRTKKYVRYQFGGVVYGKNMPLFQKGGSIRGWFSPKGVKKYPTDRELGEKHDWPIVHKRKTYIAEFGYTTEGTHHHWTKAARQDIAAWRQFRLDVTALLKEKLKEI